MGKTYIYNFTSKVDPSKNWVIQINVSENCLTIQDSCQIKSKNDMTTILQSIESDNPDTDLIEKRGLKNLIAEWRVHNMLYELGLFRSHTMTVDFECPQNKFLTFVYRVLSLLYWHK